MAIHTSGVSAVSGSAWCHAMSRPIISSGPSGLTSDQQTFQTINDENNVVSKLSAWLINSNISDFSKVFNLKCEGDEF